VSADMRRRQQDIWHFVSYALWYLCYSVYTHSYGWFFGLFGLSPTKRFAILVFATCSVMVWYLYYQWFVGRRGVPFVWWKGALILGVILLISEPAFLSNDIMDYMAKSRAAVVYGLNPYETTIKEIPGYQNDPVLSRAFWTEWYGVYGPLWFSFLGLITRITQRITLYTLLLRLAILLTHLANAQLVFCLALMWGDDRRMAHTARLLYALNPIPLVDHVASGHNDAVMIVLILMSVYLLGKGGKRYLLGHMVYGFSIAVKSVPLMWGPLLFVWVMRKTRSIGRALLLPLLGGAALIAAYIPYKIGIEKLTGVVAQANLVDRLSSVYLIPKLIVIWDPVLGNHLYQLLRSPAGRSVFIGLFLLAYCWLAWSVWKSGLRPRELVATTLLFMGLVLTWNQPWYITWFLPFAMLSRSFYDTTGRWIWLLGVWGALYVIV